MWRNLEFRVFFGMGRGNYLGFGDRVWWYFGRGLGMELKLFSG